MSVHISKPDRAKIIHELQKQAQEVLDLKKAHRQKRPIVIEFCGSPKAGKTSCINSLSLFLKRNDFKVEIIQERASVCPVADKHSPMFNIWTACTSIAGMIGVLDRKTINCDVLILDRGVFDACCWFNWLAKNQMLETNQKETIENFLLMDSLINRIDIIFAFSAKPQTSIEREYANLLTNKLGSIMNESVLSDYLSAIKSTISQKSQYCHSILEIDTSEKDQDEVGKEVTENTLTTLRNLLMERIGYIELSKNVIRMLNTKRVHEFSEIETYFKNIKFDLRDEVEANASYLQPIPIAVFIDKKNATVLAIKKSQKAISNDSPEKEKLLLYVGGHSRFEDSTGINSSDFISICRYTLRREVQEEIGIYKAFDNITPFVIYTPDSDKSKRHIGICFVVELESEIQKLRLDPEELILNKGLSKSGRFHTKKEIEGFYDDLEAWSVEIARKCFNINYKSKTNQVSFLK